MWLSTTSMMSAVAGQGPQVALVHGRVGVLLRVEHPHQQVGHLHQPVDLDVVGDLGGVVVGQVEQDQPVERPVAPLGVQQAVASHLVPGRDAEPAPAARGALSPHVQAIVHEVVGRRTPVAASSRPVRALKVEDFPEPVAPASATTVCSPDSRSRTPARSATAAASSTTRVGQPAPCRRGRASSRPVDAVDDVAAPADQRWRPRPGPSPAGPAVLTTRRLPRATQVVDPAGGGRAAGRPTAGRPPACRARSGSGPAPRPSARSPAARRSVRASAASRRTAWSPKTASSSFCPSTAPPPATPTSAPVGMAAVEAKTTTIRARDSPLTPKARKRAVVRLSAPSSRTSSSTACCQSRTSALGPCAAVARGPAQVAPGVVGQLLARR